MGAIRIFLALVVAFDHLRSQVDAPGISWTDAVKLGFNSGYAVMFFYVISGFLITYTLETNYEPTKKGVFAFYRNRFVRIFSLYWPLMLLSIYLTGGPDNVPDLLTNVFLLGADWSVAFASYPSAHWSALPNLLHPAWTLGAELMFYAAAPLLMRRWRWALALLLSSLLIRFAFVITNGSQVQVLWTYMFAPSTFCFFMLGHFAAKLSHRYPFLANGTFLAFLAASVIVMASGNYANFDTPRFWLSVVLFAISLPALFEATKGMRPLNWLGDLSYPVYLIHLLAYTWIALLISPLFTPQSWLVGVLAFICFTLALAMVVHVMIEKPMARAMQAALPTRRRSTSNIRVQPCAEAIAPTSDRLP